ncbi:MAG TPA: hypothetical protein EYP21_11010 [Syntrophaceae bacterium]|nr:hypothetical protein [Syntrophaceae bacterium]
MANVIKDVKELERFERGELKKERFTYKKALKIFEAMWQEGITLGVLPPKDLMEGIEVDIRVASILNSCSKSSYRR